MVDSRLHGTGFALDLYERYEALAVGGGARWLRLGVVEANPRARRFWARRGYVDLRHAAGIVLGDMAHVQFIMIKTLGANTLADYLDDVPHDAANS